MSCARKRRLGEAGFREPSVTNEHPTCLIGTVTVVVRDMRRACLCGTPRRFAIGASSSHGRRRRTERYKAGKTLTPGGYKAQAFAGCCVDSAVSGPKEKEVKSTTKLLAIFICCRAPHYCYTLLKSPEIYIPMRRHLDYKQLCRLAFVTNTRPQISHNDSVLLFALWRRASQGQQRRPARRNNTLLAKIDPGSPLGQRPLKRGHYCSQINRTGLNPEFPNEGEVVIVQLWVGVLRTHVSFPFEGAAVAERLAYSPPTTTGFNTRPVGIVPDDAVSRRVFSGISRFPRPFIPAPLHFHVNHPHRLSRPRCQEPPKSLHLLFPLCISQLFHINLALHISTLKTSARIARRRNCFTQIQRDQGVRVIGRLGARVIIVRIAVPLKPFRGQSKLVSSFPTRRGHGGVVVRLLASHLRDPGSIPGGVAVGFSHVGIVPVDAADRRVFLGDLLLPSPLHSCAAPCSSHLTLIFSQDLDGNEENAGVEVLRKMNAKRKMKVDMGGVLIKGVRRTGEV
ncbi:hypothetical protein PR048_000541 [Dryococelus australis]|uniref:Ribosomal protein L2 n=1 Tax=Dryococelus australis TaxID=614101 RepID=A0ABQ9IF20_9NEOP|nr:hypothetical protein PR048_000541 [Dryococelus australis]